MAVNKVILMGNLGDDPEVRNLPSGDTVVNFRIATTEKWRNKDGDQQERTEWTRCSAFGGIADVIAEYFRKGSEIYIEGKLQTRKWEDNDGNERYTTEVRVDTFSFTGGSNRDHDSRNDRGNDRGGRSNDRGRSNNNRGGNRDERRGNNRGNNDRGGRNESRNDSRNNHGSTRNEGSQQAGGFDEFDDEIPF